MAPSLICACGNVAMFSQKMICSVSNNLLLPLPAISLQYNPFSVPAPSSDLSPQPLVFLEYVPKKPRCLLQFIKQGQVCYIPIRFPNRNIQQNSLSLATAGKVCHSLTPTWESIHSAKYIKVDNLLKLFSHILYSNLHGVPEPVAWEAALKTHN